MVTNTPKFECDKKSCPHHYSALHSRYKSIQVLHFNDFLGAPHVDSFNFMLVDGLSYMVNDLDPLEFGLTKSEKRIKLWIIDCKLEKPRVPPNTLGVQDVRVWPTESRQRGTSYKGRCWIKCGYAVDNKIAQNPDEKMIGSIPVMVKSKACNLEGMILERTLVSGPSVFLVMGVWRM